MAGDGALRAAWNKALVSGVAAPAYVRLLLQATRVLAPSAPPLPPPPSPSRESWAGSFTPTREESEAEDARNDAWFSTAYGQHNNALVSYHRLWPQRVPPQPWAPLCAELFRTSLRLWWAAQPQLCWCRLAD